jgi:glucose/arabinose dehydrogenase/PKD repeat protein
MREHPADRTRNVHIWTIRAPGLHARRAFIALALGASVGQVASRAVVTLPSGFTDAVVATIASPTGLAFTPDGRLLITTQPGRLRVYANGSLLATPALDLSGRVCADSERGLLSVAVDPSFGSNRFVYLYYTFKKHGVCERNTSRSPVNRVARFVLSDANTIDSATEVVLVDNIHSPNGNHNGGDLRFGLDGFLYVSVGDGGCDYADDSGCAGANDAARDRHVLLGKILRITSDGGIPADNPFQGSNSVRCNVTGKGSPGQVCRETYAWGLRNPFRIAMDPNVAARFFINDVGQNTWEEIDEGQAGADYGWNTREAHCATGATTNCGAPPAGMTNPVYQYAHSTGCSAITGGAFVPAGTFPFAEGTYLFSDYTCGTIFKLTPASSGGYSRETFATGLGASSAVAMLFGPNGSTQALYYTTYADGGQVRRITYTADTNRAPTAAATATPSSGPLPLDVTFDGAGSTDPDGDTLTYEWDFGDGSPRATGRTVVHTYTSAGSYTAVLTVRDGRGGTGSSTVVIRAGNTPPAPFITAPATSARFSVGETITLTGGASDAEDGTLPAASLSWTVILHHGSHTHPHMPSTAGNNRTFQAPAPEDLAATTTSYLEIHLTATDSGGLSATVTQALQPRIVDVTLLTNPDSLMLTVNGTSLVAPSTVHSWAAYALKVDAPAQASPTGTNVVFAAWSDGGAAEHTIITPQNASAYTATFAPGERLLPIADAYVRGGTYANTNFGTASDLRSKLSSSPDTTREAFLKFDIGGIAPIRGATLRVYGALTAATNIATAAHGVLSSGWSETGLTWNTRPAASGTALSTVSVPDSVKRWHEWDVTTHVQAEQGAGRTAVSLVLRNPATSSPQTVFHSREAASNAPELVVRTGDSWIARDIGSVGVAGRATGMPPALSVDASGTDIWGAADAFHFVYRSLTGDGEVAALVTNVEPVHAWSKAGVMMREALTAGARHASMFVTPAKGIAFQRRTSAGGLSTSTAGAFTTAPYWVRVTRTGSTFRGYQSADGVTWTLVGTRTIEMPAAIYVGVAVTSHDNAQLCTASFDGVSVYP